MTQNTNEELLQPKSAYRFRVRAENFGKDDVFNENITKQIASVSFLSENSKELVLKIRDDTTNKVISMIMEQLKRQEEDFEKSKFGLIIEYLNGNRGVNFGNLYQLNYHECHISDITRGTLDYGSSEFVYVLVNIKYDKVITDLTPKIISQK